MCIDLRCFSEPHSTSQPDFQLKMARKMEKKENSVKGTTAISSKCHFVSVQTHSHIKFTAYHYPKTPFFAPESPPITHVPFSSAYLSTTPPLLHLPQSISLSLPYLPGIQTPGQSKAASHPGLCTHTSPLKQGGKPLLSHFLSLTQMPGQSAPPCAGSHVSFGLSTQIYPFRHLLPVKPPHD